MIVLSHRAAQTPAAAQTSAYFPLEWRRFVRRSLARTRYLLFMIVDTYAASQEMQRLAHRRHPFAEW